MQYWINQDGVQQGPVTLEELKEMSLNSTAYVWRAGMADWQPITQMEELAGCYTMAEPQPETVTVGRPLEWQIPAIPAQATQPTGPEQAKCPPTNLGWAIVFTLLCCLPTGVVAIIYAAKVSSRYQAGDLAGAQKASETSAWWCIISVVMGILYMPISMLMGRLISAALG